MIPIALAMVVAAPLQLAAAAGLEVTGGYDSTVLNPLTQTFGDGGILRTAVDVQVGHRTESVRQVLRVRGEMYFQGGEGRAIDEAPTLMSLNRYTLNWDDGDRWSANLVAAYNVGQGALLMQRSLIAGSPFQAGVFGEYQGSASLTRGFSENARMVLHGGIDGRHTLDVPVGTPRSDQVEVGGGLTGSLDVGERNTFGLTGSSQALQIVGLGDWLMRVTAFSTWRHAWSETANTTISAGVDALQDQTDATRSRWNVGPYGALTYQQVFPDANLALAVRGHYEFTTVNAIRCAQLNADGTCPPTQVIAGGAGRVGGVGLQLLWRPFDNAVVFDGEASGDYGVTENFVPGTGTVAGSPTTTRSVGNSNFTASAGARWILTRGVSVFARYTFLFQHVDEPAWFPDIVRHVAILGVTLAVFGGDAEEVLGITPLEESAAADAIRAAGGGSSSASEGGGDEGAGGVLDDGLGGGDDGGEQPAPTQPTQPTVPGHPQQPVQAPAPTGRPEQPLQPGRTRQTPPPAGASENSAGPTPGAATQAP